MFNFVAIEHCCGSQSRAPSATGYPVNRSGAANPVSLRWQISRLMLAVLLIFMLSRHEMLADSGYYAVVQLAFTNAVHPSINNTGEVVWAGQNSGGIYSSERGQLSATGQSPHIANSGEVVYADSFGGSGLDLVSTTRGRLTTNGVIDL